MSEPTSLSDDEAFVYLMNIHSAMLAYQNVFFLGTEGTLDASLQLALTETMKAVVPTRGFKWYWEQRGEFFTPQFSRFVESLMETAGSEGAKIYK